MFRTRRSVPTACYQIQSHHPYSTAAAVLISSKTRKTAAIPHPIPNQLLHDQSFRKMGSDFLTNLNHVINVPFVIRQGAENLYERAAEKSELAEKRYRVKALAAASLMKLYEKEITEKLFLGDPKCSIQDLEFAADLVAKTDKMTLKEDEYKNYYAK